MKAKEKKTRASEKLQAIIEDALQRRADFIALEYADGGPEISYMVGQIGAGHVLTDRALARELLGRIVIG